MWPCPCSNYYCDITLHKYISSFGFFNEYFLRWFLQPAIILSQHGANFVKGSMDHKKKERKKKTGTREEDGFLLSNKEVSATYVLCIWSDWLIRIKVWLLGSVGCHSHTCDLRINSNLMSHIICSLSSVTLVTSSCKAENKMRGRLGSNTFSRWIFTCVELLVSFPCSSVPPSCSSTPVLQRRPWCLDDSPID